jgi:hypothetical protein
MASMELPLPERNHGVSTFNNGKMLGVLKFPGTLSDQQRQAFTQWRWSTNVRGCKRWQDRNSGIRR